EKNKRETAGGLPLLENQFLSFAILINTDRVPIRTGVDAARAFASRRGGPVAVDVFGLRRRAEETDGAKVSGVFIATHAADLRAAVTEDLSLGQDGVVDIQHRT